MPDYIITMVDNIAQSRIKTLTEKTRSFTKRTKLPFYPVSDKNLNTVFPPLSASDTVYLLRQFREEFQPVRKRTQ